MNHSPSQSRHCLHCLNLYDCGIQASELKIKSKTILESHVLGRWYAVAIPDHGPDSTTRHLWLRNKPRLTSVKSEASAPYVVQIPRCAPKENKIDQGSCVTNDRS
jgi:hypothetical protein